MNKDKVLKKQVLDKRKNNTYQRKYGVSLEFVEDLKAKQKNRCAICKKVNHNLHVDHHHDSGTVRGLLCGTCNRGIGNLRESVDILLAAIKYLMFWSNKYKVKTNV
ncbi:endonuclease VII domain-containing protein [Methylotenera sp.]|uniref:endonuclease VII domain-containing protein n=1 Tax=Methylotenera sp. TaxID=2051956 RepID=UPI00345B73DE